jgi:hypothetical protein
MATVPASNPTHSNDHYQNCTRRKKRAKPMRTFLQLQLQKRHKPGDSRARRINTNKFQYHMSLYNITLYHTLYYIIWISLPQVRFDREATLSKVIVWVTIPFSLVTVERCFGRPYNLNLWGRRVRIWTDEFGVLRTRNDMTGCSSVPDWK